MPYDRYDTRSDRERGRYSDFDRDRERGRHEDRGFFERASDEISSWFGDDEAERRRREDERMNRGRGRDFERDRYAYGGGSGREFERGRFQDEDRGSRRPMTSTSSDRDYRSGFGGTDRDFSPRGYGGGPGYGAGTDRGYGSGGFGGGYDRSETPWGRDDYRRTSFAGSGRDTDRHYHEWRQRQLDELDRDYDEYRREHQQRFESDFGTWRQNRQKKRGLLGELREHMEVVGSDGEQIGKVDKVRGDHIILTKDDSEDDRAHSITCTMIDTVEGDQVRLDVPAEEAKKRWKDEDERGFFGRESDDEHVNLERSFAGTYR